MKHYDRTFTENEIMAIIAAADDESTLDLGGKTFSFSAMPNCYGITAHCPLMTARI